MAKDPPLEKDFGQQSEDDILVARAGTDSNSFILLYDIYYEKIYRYCFGRLKSKQITEDTMSMVFSRAAENIRWFKGRTRKDFVAWLCGMADELINEYLKNKHFEENLKKIDAEQIQITDSGHKEKLRAKVLRAYESGQIKKEKTFLYIALSAVVLIAVIIIFYIPWRKSATAPVKQQPKPAAESNAPGVLKMIKRPAAANETETTTSEEKEPNETAKENEVEETPLKSESVKKEKSIAAEGVRVTGRVVDWENRPMEAIVTLGPFPKENGKKTTCDANGWFRFDNVTEGIEVFTAQASGAAPKIMPADVNELMEPIIFTLEQPNTISGIILDVNGTTVENASLRAVLWQGIGALDFETKTDASGFFQWTDAPADEVLFDIQKKGYMSVRNYAMKSGIEYKIMLMPPVKIRGNIISGAVNETIDTFIITVGYHFEKNKITWEDANSIVFSGDKYELFITEPVDFQLKVKAEGFETAESPVFSPQQIGATYDFVLKPEQ